MNVLQLEVLIVEDDSSFSKTMKKIINQIGINSYIVANSEQAISHIKNKTPDLVLLDLDIESGKNKVIKLAKEVSSLKIPLLFISSEEQPDKDYLKNIPSLGFIKKSEDNKSLSLITNIVLNTLTLSNLKVQSKSADQKSNVLDRLFLKKNNILHKVMLADILYILANGDYCKIHSKDDIFVLKSTLSKIQRKLRRNNFARIHKSHLVNMEHIVQIALSKNELLMEDKTKLSIGRAFKDSLMKQLSTLG